MIVLVPRAVLKPAISSAFGWVTEACRMEFGFLSGLTQVEAPDGSDRHLQVKILRPAGTGPFPLAVVNHGSPPNRRRRSIMSVPSYRSLSTWLLARGYAVALPLRRGYGTVGGQWDETYGACRQPDYVRAGLETARDIEAVLAAIRTEAFIDASRTVVFGQSAGGWGSLALASRNPPNVLAYINFAGGRGGHRGGIPHANCKPESLVRAAARYGRTARRPSLWLYAENDSYFRPRLVKRMHRAFVQAGGRASLHVLPAFGRDGHQFISRRDSVAVWGPIVAKFLARFCGRATK